ncbi:MULTISPECIES: hypothetical protein [Terrabacteria group]|uniref:hypothetical protein n=1 Tax=Bacillati TaxID=1783272 RepID=UPI001C6E1D98|nr:MULTISPECIES: hypothetical protein [Terrabacteria group]MBW9212983.1 hypothetical protein [Trueperella sp. zg.1013]
MEESLLERLKILLDAEMISKQNYFETMLVMKKLFEKINCLDQERMEVFATHYATSIQRIDNKDEDFEVDINIRNSILEMPNSKEITDVLEEIKSLTKRQYPIGEETLLLVHLSNLITNKKGGE